MKRARLVQTSIKRDLILHLICLVVDEDRISRWVYVLSFCHCFTVSTCVRVSTVCVHGVCPRVCPYVSTCVCPCMCPRVCMCLCVCAARVGLMHIGVFILLLLSGERNFGVRLNKPYSVRVPMDIPVFTGSHADFLIIVSCHFHPPSSVGSCSL